MWRRRAAWLLVVAAGVAACADSSATGPQAQPTLGIGPGGGGGPDTSHALPGTVRVHGRVLAVSVTAPAAAAPGDTLHFEPVAGAAVRVVRNVITAGVASEELVAQTTTSAAGEYQVDALPGGYYIVRVTPPAGSPYADSWSYLPATAADVKADVYVWRKQ